MFVVLLIMLTILRANAKDGSIPHLGVIPCTCSLCTSPPSQLPSFRLSEEVPCRAEKMWMSVFHV